jgi:hypothetical protein
MGGLGELIACIGSGRIARGHGTFSSFGMSMIQPSFLMRRIYGFVTPTLGYLVLTMT